MQTCCNDNLPIIHNARLGIERNKATLQHSHEVMDIEQYRQCIQTQGFCHSPLRKTAKTTNNTRTTHMDYKHTAQD